jgi:transposase-like protein
MGMDVVAKIRQATRRKYTAEEKIRIVLEGLRGEIPISELCRREGIAPTMYYRWSKAFQYVERDFLLNFIYGVHHHAQNF